MGESADTGRVNHSEATAVDESGKPLSVVAMLFSPDRRGLVARVAGWIYDHGGNVLHADQHRDAERSNWADQRLGSSRTYALGACIPVTHSQS